MIVDWLMFLLLALAAAPFPCPECCVSEGECQHCQSSSDTFDYIVDILNFQDATCTNCSNADGSYGITVSDGASSCSGGSGAGTFTCEDRLSNGSCASRGHSIALFIGEAVGSNKGIRVNIATSDLVNDDNFYEYQWDSGSSGLLECCSWDGLDIPFLRQETSDINGNSYGDPGCDGSGATVEVTSVC